MRLEYLQCLASLQVFLQADRLKDAVSSLVAVGEWDRARRIVRELAPDLEPYLEEKYQDAMMNDDQVDRLAGADSALEMMARKGQWSQVFEAASSQGPELLHRFVARRAAQLLKSDSASQALQLYAQYGAPAMPQNYNLYLQLAENILNKAQQEYRYVMFPCNFLPFVY
jgi:intraflagellar transport protein 172